MAKSKPTSKFKCGSRENKTKIQSPMHQKPAHSAHLQHQGVCRRNVQHLWAGTNVDLAHSHLPRQYFP